MKNKFLNFLTTLKHDRLLPKKFFFSTLGVVIMGFAVPALIYSGLGTDPCTCANLAMAQKTGLAFWQWSAIINSVLFLFPLFLNRSLIGYGTIINMYLISIIADALRASFYRTCLPAQPGSLLIRIVFMLAGLLLLCVGAAFYTVAGMGVAPYDSIPIILANHLHWSFRWVRISFDSFFLILGFVLGGPVGISTVLTAFCLGPIIQAVGGWLQHRYLTPTSGGIAMRRE